MQLAVGSPLEDIEITIVEMKVSAMLNVAA